MQSIDKEQFDALINSSHIKPRLRRELRFKLPEDDWTTMDFFIASVRAQDQGVLIVPTEKGYFLASFSGRSRIKATGDGRAKAAICDLCYTWRSGGSSALIMFSPKDDTRAIGILCCLDLRCSQHVRSLTEAAHISRAQLPESLSVEQRVLRLQERLQALMKRIEADHIDLQGD